MPIQTDLNISPYHDDFKRENDYYKILFKPGVAVQVRELNQLQTILQDQIERFGDNIYRKGTIIEGCGFKFHNNMQFAKIKDNETDGTSVVVSTYNDYFVKNQDGVKARIIDTVQGYESTDPDLNTLFLYYIAGSDDATSVQFEPGDTLEIYSPNYGVLDVDISVGSQNFSNNDNVHFLSALKVSAADGLGSGKNFVNNLGQACTFSVGETLTQTDVTGIDHTVEIVEIIDDYYDDSLVLRIRPVASDLRLANTTSWDIQPGEFLSSTTKIKGQISNLIGSGAEGSIITNNDGSITTCVVLSSGTDYIIDPYIAVSYEVSNNSTALDTDINALSLIPKTYIAQVSIPDSLDSVGTGYAMTVSEGIVYQKGYFSRVDESLIIVDKYNSYTDKVVGFETIEEIVDFREDSALTDNSFTLNENAPGADRLRLRPVLVSYDKDEAAEIDDFFAIVEFSEGKPYKQHTKTVFNSIGDELAKRTYEESGNYVIDEFLIKENAEETLEDDAQSFELFIDPGLAYVQGRRVETKHNATVRLRKGTDTKTKEISTQLGYGNYVIVDELMGEFKFNTGDLVKLYNTPKNHLSTASLTTPSPTGRLVGYARLRSLVLYQGVPGTPQAQYKLYLFDINMFGGRKFEKDVKSFFYDGTNKGISDSVLVGGLTQLKGIRNTNSLLFDIGELAVKEVKNVSYQYRTVDSSASFSTNGVLSSSLPTAGEYFPYNSTLSDLEKSTLIVTPTATAYNTTNLSGTVDLDSSGNITNGTAGFNDAIEIGDYVRVTGATPNQIGRVIQKNNNTTLKLNLTGSTATSSTIALVFPANIPINLDDRRTVTVASNNNISVDLGLGSDVLNTDINASIVYNVATKPGSNVVEKKVLRNRFVKINLGSKRAKRALKTSFLWDLGVPDVIALKAVYYSTTSNVTTTDIDLSRHFCIQNGQFKNGYGHAKLACIRPRSWIQKTFAKNGYLLVQFDCLNPSSKGGLKTISSYPINDTLAINDNDATLHTLEVPEIFSNQGEYYDLRDYLDFRPYQATSINIVNSAEDPNITTLVSPIQAGSSYLTKYDTTVEKRFPVPQSICSAEVTYYVGRNDILCMSSNGSFTVLEGKPSDYDTTSGISVPSSSMFLTQIKIPPYPSTTNPLHPEVRRMILRRSRSGNRVLNRKIQDYRISFVDNPLEKLTSQPKRYTMHEIGQLERRIKDLEYYIALSYTEDTVNALQLKSSVDGTSERFKFGFFVDNFTTLNHTNVHDSKYRARIYNNRVVPSRVQFNMPYKFNYNDEGTKSLVVNGVLTLPYESVKIVGNDFATGATTVNVTTEETIVSIDKQKVLETVKTTERLEITEYEKRTKTQTIETTTTTKGKTVTEQKKTGTKIVVQSTGSMKNVFTANHPARGATKSVVIDGVPKTYILAYGGKQKKANIPKMQILVGGTWYTANGYKSYSGSGIVQWNKLLGHTYTGYDGSRAWCLVKEFDPDKYPGQDGKSRTFRVAHNGGSDVNCFNIRYMGGKEAEVPVYKTTTKTIPGKTTVTSKAGKTFTQFDTDVKYETRTYIESESNIVEVGREKVQRSLFNSNRIKLDLVDQLFDSGNLESPYVDLASFIYEDINDLGPR